jgi:hypothetical protein
MTRRASRQAQCSGVHFSGCTVSKCDWSCTTNYRALHLLISHIRILDWRKSGGAMEPIPSWTAIAYRRHDEQHWISFEGAPFTIVEARQMVAKGLLLMAQKRLPEMTILMVMSPRHVMEQGEHGNQDAV